MRRRKFIALFGSVVAAWSSKLLARQPERISRVSLPIALTESDPESVACVAFFRRGLQELGWLEGKNLRIDIRWAAGDIQKEPAYAAELLSLAPNVAVAHGTPAVFAFKSKRPTMPIVFRSSR
jgi:putative tryptophan/tyrosine transport system substrate-binding protein